MIPEQKKRDWKTILMDYVTDDSIQGGKYDASSKIIPNKPTSGIPTFYVPKYQSELGKQLREVAKQYFIGEKNDLVLSNDDLDSLLKILQERASKKDGTDKINYQTYFEISESLPYKFQRFFKPSTFLRLRHDDDGKVEVQTLFNFILRCASIQQERVCIAAYDFNDDCTLSEESLEKYLQELIPTFPQLDSMEKNFESFYLCGACRKFFFILDPQRLGRISISQILLSPILSEFFELQQSDLDSTLLLSNWFSLYSAMKVYGQYVELDTDQNGMLNSEELCNFARGRYNKLIIDRVFEEYQTFSSEIDYKNYLDFVLAINDLQSKRSQTYFFKLLDIKSVGFVDEAVLSYIVNPLVTRLSGIPFIMKDFVDELFDMANCKEVRSITLKNIHSCGVGGTIVSLLIDYQAFYANQTKD